MFDGDEHGHSDPAIARLSKKVADAAERRRSLPEDATEEEIRASKAEVRESIEQTVKEYLNPNERFAERMRRSMTKNGETDDDRAVAEQQNLMTKDAKVQLIDNTHSSKYPIPVNKS